MDYMQWAKVHAKVRYELTGSGVPKVTADELNLSLSEIDLEPAGPYGRPDLIDAIAKRYDVSPDGVVPVPGASSAIFIAIGTICRPGDQILVERPVYHPIERVAAFLGLATAYFARTPRDAFRILPDDIETHLTSAVGGRVRAVVVTNLHNPSGQCTPRSVMTQIAAVCARHDATLIVDEVYLDAAHLNTGQPRWTAAQIGDNVIGINSLTKVYGLSGLRIGWLMTHPRVAEEARRVMDVISVNNAAPSMLLATRALEHMDCLEKRFQRFFKEGRPVFEQWLDNESSVVGYENHGAIFEWVRLPDGVSASRLNEVLVERFDTQVVPGGFFGMDDHIRLTTAVPPADLEEALRRISTAIREM